MKRTLGIVLMSISIVSCNGSDDDQGSTVQVYTSTQAVQCEDTGLSLSETAETLTSAGIDVLSSSCGRLTGIEPPAQCGIPTTEINVHEIRVENQTDAEQLDFNPVTEISEDEGLGYQLVDCPEQL